MLAGAIALGAAQLAEAVAFSGHWNDMPVSMRVIGGLFCAIGVLVVTAALSWDRDADHFTIVSGAILVLAGSVVFAFGKLALAIDYPAGRTEKRIVMLAVGTSLCLAGLAITVWQAIPHRRSPPT